MIRYLAIRFILAHALWAVVISFIMWRETRDSKPRVRIVR